MRRGQTPGTLHIDKRADAISVDGDGDQLLDITELATLLGVSVQWLKVLGMRGEGPRPTRMSPLVIRYSRADIRKWLAERTKHFEAEKKKRQQRRLAKKRQLAEARP
jgi:predicted DNA-binding transcriptional regulator AlpA